MKKGAKLSDLILAHRALPAYSEEERKYEFYRRQPMGRIEEREVVLKKRSWIQFMKYRRVLRVIMK